MKCSSFFDLGCHMRHICMTRLLLFGLFLAIFPTVILLLWLLHETGLFDPIYDWWQDNFWDDEQKMQHVIKQRPDDWNKQHKKKSRNHTDGTHKDKCNNKRVLVRSLDTLILNVVIMLRGTNTNLRELRMEVSPNIHVM